MTETNAKFVEWIHCNQCLRQTRHEVVAVRQLREQEELMDKDGLPAFMIDWLTTYTVLECRGCGGITLRRRVVSDDVDVDETTYYPPQISRKSPRWQYELPEEFRDLLKESYAALHAGSKRLAIMGARALVDLFMTTTIGDVGGFQQKLEQLVQNGFLSQQNRKVLEAALEAGHAVSHRGHQPKERDVDLVFDIVENLLQTMVLSEKAEELKKNTPKRKSNNGIEPSR